MAEKFTNMKGSFMKFAKLSNGSLKYIIIAGGNSRWGWRRMVDCLDNLVGKRF